MEPLRAAFTTYQFDVEVITPVHVGMAQEKNYMPGLDFVQKDSTITFLNPDGLFKALQEINQMDTVLADITAGKFDELNKFLLGLPIIRDADVRLREETVETLGRAIREIRRAFVSGLGQPAIPGTSVKGALRSVLLWHLTRSYTPQADNWGKIDETLFGPITANLMRYIQSSDVVFEPQQLKVFPVKVFSGDGNPRVPGDTKGTWKHGRNDNSRLNHHPDFMPRLIESNANEGFINFYESLRPKSAKSQLRLSVGNALQGEWLNVARSINGYAQTIETLTGGKLIELIRMHTSQYLGKEKAYYRQFQNDDLGDVLTVLERLERHNQAENSCLLRVGANVGFHSITGDWRDVSRDHYSKWAGTAIKYKTRKFDVVTDPNRDFLLPGFLKLTLISESKNEETRQKTERNMADFGQTFITSQQQKEQSRQKRLDEERRKHEPTYLNKVPRKGDRIDAVVVKTGSPAVRIRLYVSENAMPEVLLRYPNLPVGTVLTIIVNNASPKGVINDYEVAFGKIKKEA